MCIINLINNIRIIYSNVITVGTYCYASSPLITVKRFECEKTAI